MRRYFNIKRSNRRLFESYQSNTGDSILDKLLDKVVSEGEKIAIGAFDEEEDILVWKDKIIFSDNMPGIDNDDYIAAGGTPDEYDDDELIDYSMEALEMANIWITGWPVLTVKEVIELIRDGYRSVSDIDNPEDVPADVLAKLRDVKKPPRISKKQQEINDILGILSRNNINTKTICDIESFLNGRLNESYRFHSNRRNYSHFNKRLFESYQNEDLIVNDLQKLLKDVILPYTTPGIKNYNGYGVSYNKYLISIDDYQQLIENSNEFRELMQKYNITIDELWDYILTANGTNGDYYIETGDEWQDGSRNFIFISQLDNPYAINKFIYTGENIEFEDNIIPSSSTIRKIKNFKQNYRNISDKNIQWDYNKYF